MASDARTTYFCWAMVAPLFLKMHLLTLGCGRKNTPYYILHLVFLHQERFIDTWLEIDVLRQYYISRFCVFNHNALNDLLYHFDYYPPEYWFPQEITMRKNSLLLNDISS